MFSAGEVFSQASPITRKHLRQVINEGRQDNEYSYFSILGCNEDSLYYTADTIHFYDNSRFFDQIGICCEFVQWELIGSNLLRQQEPQTCMEPSSVEISTIRYYKYRMKKQGGNVYFQLLNQKNPVATYRLVNIEYIELANQLPCTAITLVRVKKINPKETGEETPGFTLMQNNKEPSLKKLPKLRKKRRAIGENPVLTNMEPLTPKLPMLQLRERAVTAKPILKKSEKIIR